MKSDPLISFRRKPAAIDVKSLESFAEILRDRVSRGRDFHCRITGDADLRRWNTQFRGKQATTDVLSFPSDAPDSRGDIAISLQQARGQARQWGHKIEDEIRILMLHGVLHLLGMDHESDAGQMRRTEARWRRKLGLPNGLIERAAP